MNLEDRNKVPDICRYTPPKHRNRGKHDKPLMPQDKIDALQTEISNLKSKIYALDICIDCLDAENMCIIKDNVGLKKKIDDVEKLPQTWRKYPDSDGWKESCALDVEVALGVFSKCPLDGKDYHPRCLNLFDGIYKSSTGLCSGAKNRIG